MSAQISPDGMYYWDGTQWLSTMSHDGSQRWNGTAWVPVAGASGFTATQRASRVPTSWTRPLQYVIAGWYAISALYSLALPFWMGGIVTQAMNQSIQRQQALNPTASPPPPEFLNAMSSMMTGALWVGAVIWAALCLIAIIGALKRWTWLFYVVLVLLGFGTLSLPLDLVSVLSGSSLASLTGYTTPGWTYGVGLGLSIPGTALFVWTLVALVKRGPWGMIRPAG